MKENQIAVSAVSNLEFVEINEQEGCFAYWSVSFIHEGEEKEGELYADVYNPENNHHHTIDLY